MLLIFLDTFSAMSSTLLTAYLGDGLVFILYKMHIRNVHLVFTAVIDQSSGADSLLFCKQGLPSFYAVLHFSIPQSMVM